MPAGSVTVTWWYLNRKKNKDERSGILDGGDLSSLGVSFGDVKRRVRSMMLRRPALNLEGQRGRKYNASFQVGRQNFACLRFNLTRLLAIAGMPNNVIVKITDSGLFNMQAAAAEAQEAQEAQKSQEAQEQA